MLLIGVFTKVGWANADPAPNRYRAALIDPRVRLWSAALDLPRLPWVSWTPYHSLDLLALGLLPDGWDSAMRTLLDAPERIRILPGPGGYDLSWCFDIVEGHVLDAHLPWLSALYHGVCCDFAARAAGYPLYPANRQSAGMTLNILSGAGAVSDWHQDMTAVTGVLFVTPAQADGAGDLLFRDGAGREARLAPRPGLFVCFPGEIEHHVAPLTLDTPRLSVPLLYYHALTGQVGTPVTDIPPDP